MISFGGGGGCCLFICLFVFRSQPTQKMLSSYTARFVFKNKKNSAQQPGVLTEPFKGITACLGLLGDTVCPKIQIHGSFYCFLTPENSP